MAKLNKKYVCQNCGSFSNSWMGKCGSCGKWNTIFEEIQESIINTSTIDSPLEFKNIKDYQSEKMERLKTGFREFDSVLGGGVVKGSLNLLSGEPGVGKSTLLLQLAFNVSRENKERKILYISGEESVSQIQMRAKRLFLGEEAFSNLQIGSDSDIEKIIYSIETIKPYFIIIDSIQSLYSSKVASFPGSVSQVRFCANTIMRVVKKTGIYAFIVGQVTKEGVVAGPKILEHLVDVVMQLESSEKEDLRLLKSMKNRYGGTNEIGIFQMKEKGLNEILNPSAIFIDQRETNIPGSVKTVFLEGKRALLAEIQALVVDNHFPPLKRTASGINYNRLLLLIAVLERRLHLNLQNKDIYVKVSGGINLNDPAVDLAVCLSIISAYKDLKIESQTVAVGEVGLLGEIRKINQEEKRKIEAQKQGFSKFISPQQFKTLREIQIHLGLN